MQNNLLCPLFEGQLEEHVSADAAGEFLKWVSKNMRYASRIRLSQRFSHLPTVCAFSHSFRIVHSSV